MAISTLAAVMWMLKPENHKKGVIEPEYLQTDYVLEYCKDYLGKVLINYDCTKAFNTKTDEFLQLQSHI